MARLDDPVFTSVEAYATLVARCERDPRGAASGVVLAEAHAHWRDKLRQPEAGELRAQYQEAYRRARWGDPPPESAPTAARAPVAAPPVMSAPPPIPPAVVPAPQNPFGHCLARGEAIVAEALAVRDRWQGRKP